METNTGYEGCSLMGIKPQPVPVDKDRDTNALIEDLETQLSRTKQRLAYMTRRAVFYQKRCEAMKNETLWEKICRYLNSCIWCGGDGRYCNCTGSDL